MNSGLRPNNFDLVRLLAAAQVVIVHSVHHLKIPHLASSPFLDWLSYFPGVPVFFVMSGFLVSASYERSKSQSDYWLKRSVRIFPGLWVCLAVAILSVLVLAPSLFIEASFTKVVAWVIAQATFFQFYNPDFLRDYGVGTLNGSLWTIPVELQFYLVLPIIYWLTKTVKADGAPTNQRLIVTLLAFVVIAQIFFRLPEQWHNSLLLKFIKCSMIPHVWLFILGILAQRNFAYLRPWFDGKLFQWLVIHFLAIVTFKQFGLDSGYNAQLPILCLTLSGLAFAFAFTFRGASDKILGGNDISYGVYIYHMVIVNGLLTLGMSGTNLSLLLAVVLTAVFAYLSWRLVEKPALSFKKNTAST